MALARIISNSPQCSRELALNLLDRGYAVEIVSPDAIPDNLADLELRVESGPGDILTASVEASRDGGRSASLHFVHHLKTPMPEFRRTPPEASAPAPLIAVPVASSAKPNVVEEVQALSNSVEAPKPARTEPKTLVAQGDITRVIRVPSWIALKDTLESFRATVKMILRQYKLKRVRISLPGGWFWRATLTFGGVVLIALAVGLGTTWLGGTGAAPKYEDSRIEGQAPGENYASSLLAVPIVAIPGLPAAEHAAPAVVPGLSRNGGRPSPVSKNSGAARVKSTTSKSHRKNLRRGGDDLIAPDTITYFDRPGAKPIPVKQFINRRPPSHKGGGRVIAAGAVTGLNGKTAREGLGK